MLSTIKAIETVYPWPNGPRYRSRLEARWAVFFDTLGIKYEYEKEGFDLGKFGKYLPDFWLPHLGMWFEVKGELKHEEHVWNSRVYSLYPELQRCETLADCTGRPAACAVGSIGDHEIHFYAWDVTDSSGGSYSTDHAEWCLSNGIYTLDVDPGRRDREFISDNLCGEVMPQFRYSQDFGSSRDEVRRAYIAARQARFEHGEHGR